MITQVSLSKCINFSLLAPIVTSPYPLKQNKGAMVSMLKHKRRLEVSPTTSFAWYLHEELLEIQFWMTSVTTISTSQRPHDGDKLIGSSYVPLKEFSSSPYDSKSIR